MPTPQKMSCKFQMKIRVFKAIDYCHDTGAKFIFIKCRLYMYAFMSMSDLIRAMT